MGAQSATRAWDTLIGDLAERQHGVVARWQLQRLGMGRRAIGGRLGRGSLRAIYRGVYAVGHRLIGVSGRRMAAVLACGPDTVLSHRSAARAWLIAPAGSGWPEVICEPSRRVERPGILCHRVALAPDEKDEVDGIPVTSVYRTIFDLAAVGTKREVERAYHEAEVRQLTARVSLPMLLERYPGHRGAAAVRTILASREPAGITRSELEERFLTLLDAHDIPRPRLNADLQLRGRFFEVDCLWEWGRLVAELDGAAVHGASQAFHRDRERDRILLTHGFRVLHVTWRQLHDEPEAIVADLRRLLDLPTSSRPTGPSPTPPGK